MTIEIRQLVIRAVVDERAAVAEPAAARRPGRAAAAATTALAGQALAEAQQTLVAACVREVLRRIDRARER